MVPEQLEPCLELLREEYVLVQAWKKTASYIRYHNWFSDTLALDRAAVNLPAFLGKLRERLQSWESWENDSLRIVPAPKSQRWRVREGAWEPVKGARSAQLRPLGHVSLADQVVATALMLCLADRVETLQGIRGDRYVIRSREDRWFPTATACSATRWVGNCAIGGDPPSSTAPTTRTTARSSPGAYSGEKSHPFRK